MWRFFYCHTRSMTDKSYYYLYNGHGDVVQIVDTSGTIVNSYDYDVWGNFITKQETIDNHFTYFSQTYDEITALYYLRARYYDPTTGCFTQQDPAKDGYNWYMLPKHMPKHFTIISDLTITFLMLKFLLRQLLQICQCQQFHLCLCLHLVFKEEK